LELVPYNGFWIGCIQNNLISILLKESELFNLLPLTIQGQYLKKLTTQFSPNDNNYHSYLRQGLFLPKVEYQTDELYSFFNMDVTIIDESLSGLVHELVKEALTNNQYVFLDVNRFFYPSGRESNKIHFGHPAFIYNINETDKYYYAFDDCLTPGHMHPYSIPFDAVESSVHYLHSRNREIRLVKVKADEKKINSFKPEFNHFSDFACLLHKDDIIIQYNQKYQLGISCLDLYEEQLEELIHHLDENSLFALRTSNFIQYHQRNISILNLFNSMKKIDERDYHYLTAQYEELKDSWKLFKNKILKDIVLNNKHDYESLKKTMQSIIYTERRLSNYFN